MMCESCQRNTASVHMTSFINGQVKTVHLCGQCAAQKKGAVVIPWFSFNDFLSTFFEGEEAQDIKCDICGITLSAFKKCGKLGCENCYKVFEQHILPVLKGIHMNAAHTGKHPGERVNINSTAEETFGRKEQLKQKLREAVAVENFEEAACLRDEIALLDKEGEQ